MFDECGFDVYISQMQVVEERERDEVDIEAEEQRLQFYAVVEQLRERWFELEAIFRRTGDPAPLDKDDGVQTQEHLLEQLGCGLVNVEGAMPKMPCPFARSTCYLATVYFCSL